MKKIFFHNTKFLDNNKVKRKSTQVNNINKKLVVDINILLNRVKLEKNEKIKKNFIIASTALLIIVALIIF
jgi:hypothetical protein